MNEFCSEICHEKARAKISHVLGRILPNFQHLDVVRIMFVSVSRLMFSRVCKSDSSQMQMFPFHVVVGYTFEIGVGYKWVIFHLIFGTVF